MLLLWELIIGSCRDLRAGNVGLFTCLFFSFPTPGRLHKVFSFLFFIETHTCIHTPSNFKIPHHHLFFRSPCNFCEFLFWKVLAFFIYSYPLLWTHFPSWLDTGPFSIISLLPSHNVGVAPCPSPMTICRLYQGIKITICDPKAIYLILCLLTQTVIEVDTLFLSKRKWFKMLLSIFLFKL